MILLLPMETINLIPSIVVLASIVQRDGNMSSEKTSIQITPEVRDRLYRLKFRRTYDQFLVELCDLYEEKYTSNDQKINNKPWCFSCFLWCIRYTYNNNCDNNTSSIIIDDKMNRHHNSIPSSVEWFLYISNILSLVFSPKFDQEFSLSYQTLFQVNDLVLYPNLIIYCYKEWSERSNDPLS